MKNVVKQPAYLCNDGRVKFVFEELKTKVKRESRFNYPFHRSYCQCLLPGKSFALLKPNSPEQQQQNILHRNQKIIFLLYVGTC